MLAHSDTYTVQLCDSTARFKATTNAELDPSAWQREPRRTWDGETDRTKGWQTQRMMMVMTELHCQRKWQQRLALPCRGRPACVTQEKKQTQAENRLSHTDLALGSCHLTFTGNRKWQEKGKCQSAGERPRIKPMWHFINTGPGGCRGLLPRPALTNNSTDVKSKRGRRTLSLPLRGIHSPRVPRCIWPFLQQGRVTRTHCHLLYKKRRILRATRGLFHTLSPYKP